MAIYDGKCNVDCKWKVDTDTKVLEVWAEKPSALQDYGVEEEKMPPWRDYRSYIETINIDKNIINIPFNAQLRDISKRKRERETQKEREDTNN